MSSVQISQGRKTETLEELTKKDCWVLFDTSVIMQPLGKGKNDLDFKQVEEKTYLVSENSKFIRQMAAYVKEKENFFIVSSFIDELSKGCGYRYKKGVNKRGSLKNRPLLKFCRALRDAEKERTKLINSFQENERIIKLGEKKEIYSIIYNKYQGILNEFGLTDTNIEFLLTGITLAMTSTPVILVSNKYGILRAGNKIVVGNYINEKDIRFFNRTDYFKFSPFDIDL